MFSLIRKQLTDSVRCRSILNLAQCIHPLFHNTVRSKNDSIRNNNVKTTDQFKSFKTNGIEVNQTEESCTVKMPFCEFSNHKVSTEFENNTLILKGKSVKQNGQNDYEIRRYTHKFDLKNNYAKHAITVTTEDCDLIVTIPIKDKNETIEP